MPDICSKWKILLHRARRMCSARREDVCPTHDLGLAASESSVRFERARTFFPPNLERFDAVPLFARGAPSHPLHMLRPAHLTYVHLRQTNDVCVHTQREFCGYLTRFHRSRDPVRTLCLSFLVDDGDRNDHRLVPEAMAPSNTIIL